MIKVYLKEFLFISFCSLVKQGVPEGFGEVEEPEEMVPPVPIPQPAPQLARSPVVAPQQPPAPQPAPQPAQGEGEMEEEDIGEGGSLRGRSLHFIG